MSMLEQSYCVAVTSSTSSTRAVSVHGWQKTSIWKADALLPHRTQSAAIDTKRRLWSEERDPEERGNQL